jgi:8-oxo-dGTP diphosphatase
MTEWVINFDGACEGGNPGGVATWGFVVYGPPGFFYSSYGVVGEGDGMTNNISEYTALMRSLEYFKELLGCVRKGDSLVIHGDSQLVIYQMSGKWRVKAKNLMCLYDQCMRLIEFIGLEGVSVVFVWVPREQNEEADELSKRAYLEYCAKKGMDVKLCSKCGSSMVLHENKKNGYRFYGCSRYPKCRETEAWVAVDMGSGDEKRLGMPKQLLSPITMAIAEAEAKVAVKIRDVKESGPCPTCGEYGPRPSLAVDGIVTMDGKLLLVKRRNEPFRGKWALPGGYVNIGESAETAVLREVLEETGVKGIIGGLLGVYSDPGRDPRNTVSVVYVIDSNAYQDACRIKAGDDAEDAMLFNMDRLPDLAFDHAIIINDYLQSKIAKTIRPGGFDLPDDYYENEDYRI